MQELVLIRADDYTALDYKYFRRVAYQHGSRDCLYGVAPPCSHPNCLEAYAWRMWDEYRKSSQPRPQK